MTHEQAKLFTSFIGRTLDEFTDTNYSDWYYGDDDFSTFMESVHSIIVHYVYKEFNNSTFNNWLVDYDLVVLNEKDIVRLYEQEELELDGDDIEYIENNHLTKTQIANLIISGDENDNRRTIGDNEYIADYVLRYGFDTCIDIDATVKRAMKSIDILHVNNVWFYDFLDGHGNIYDGAQDDYDLLAKDFYDALTESGCIITPLIELTEIDDEIGETTPVDGMIDYNTRDMAAVYIGNGEFIIGSRGESHTQMLNEWLKNHNKDQLSEQWFRTDSEEVQQATGGQCVAFCHIIGDCLFVDNYMEHCTIEEVTKAAKATGDFRKVYLYNCNDDTITRTAKRLLANNILRLYKILGKHVPVKQVW